MKDAGLTDLVIRADADARIGSGHLMRCLALAQAWSGQGGRVTFVTACQSAALCRRLTQEGFEVIALKSAYPDSRDWEATSRCLVAHRGAWVVLDGYGFDATYQLRVKALGHHLLVIDDTGHLDHYHADVLLNQNIGAELLEYSCDPGTRLLLGTRYVLLRTEFLSWRDWPRETPRVGRRVLVTLGGGDPHNQTLKAVRAVQSVDVDELETQVVVGADNPHFRAIESLVSGFGLRGRVVRNALDMPSLMAWADVAIAGGGSTCWELAFMGLPTAVLVVAENQQGIAAGLHEAGAMLSLGWYAQVSFEDVGEALVRLLRDRVLREGMTQRCRLLVDGMGAARVVEALGALGHQAMASD